MKPIVQDRARAAFTQLREDLRSVAPGLGSLLRYALNCIAPISRTVTVRVCQAWQCASPSIDVQRTLDRRKQEEA